MAKPIDFLFGLRTLVGRTKQKFNRICQVVPMCHHGRTLWRNLANMTELSISGSNAALCQITLTTCWVILIKSQHLYCSCCYDYLPSVVWHCWLGVRKSIRPVNNWVMRWWCGYLPRPRCRWFADASADASATPSSLAWLKSRLVWHFWCQLTYIKNHMSELHKIFCTSYLGTWRCFPLTTAEYVIYFWFLWIISCFHIMDHMVRGVGNNDVGAVLKQVVIVLSIFTRDCHTVWLCLRMHWQQMVYQGRNVMSTIALF